MARGAGAEVMAEVELASRHLRGRLAAVTGTKGKSTTTAALGAVLREAGLDVRVGGNIGQPLIGLVEGSTEDTVFAVEVSSFQLEGTSRFHPQVAVWLNLSPDHLDRHPSLDAYVAAKARVFAQQDEADWAVVNADDPVVLEQARRARGRLLRLRVTGEPLPEGDGAFFRAGEAWMRRDGREERLFARADVRLPGAAPRRGPPGRGGHGPAARRDRRRRGARGGRLRGRRARPRARGDDRGSGLRTTTRRPRTWPRLPGASRPSRGAVLVILGGRYKGGDFALLAPRLRAHGSRVLAIGEARDRLEVALGAHVPVDGCASLRGAVERARALARTGDTVLLAPACSSFDMFTDYAERGRAFKDEVRRLGRRPRRRSEGTRWLRGSAPTSPSSPSPWPCSASAC